MPVLPFHRYIGPGNPSENGPPIDEDDRIAKQHDHSYDRARSEEDVRTADLQAIASFRRNWLRDGNWHSIIGDLGLSIKYSVETFTGVIYPDLRELINEECRVIIINKVLKLHCVFKRKPFLEKYKFNPYMSMEARLKCPKILALYLGCETDFNKLIPSFFYVPLNWPKIYINCEGNPLVFLKELEERLDKIDIKMNISKDSMKIITKYLEFIIKNVHYKKNDKYNEKMDRTDMLELLHSGHIFIDQDGNLHLEGNL